MAGVAKLFEGGIVTDKKENIIDLKSHCAGKIVGIYFSAHWCPPCRGFTPQLAQFYKKYAESKNFEIIFASSDSSVEKFKEYYDEMPWLALEFKHNAIKV